jgi:hypothetical protein
MEASRYSTRPTYSGIFLPNLSSSGPQIIWPIHIPIKKLAKEYETMSTETLRSFAIAGKPGRYISMENGPIADKRPRINIMSDLFFLFIIF